MAKVNIVSGIDNTNYNTSTNKASSGSSSDFSSYLGESRKLDNIFDEAADKYNVPVELLKAVGKTESNFNANAVSSCGAQGIMQLMPATAKSLGVTNSFDPEQNIMAGAKYISGLLKKYDGNESLALAAYNAGSGNVAKYGGIPPFKETQNYVKKVLNFMKQGGTDTGSTDTSSVNSSSDSNNQANVLHVASVTAQTPVYTNTSFLLSDDTSGSGNAAQDLETLFSYDDYLKFLDKFFDDAQEEKKTNNLNNSSKDISYNAPVLNLLIDQKSN